MSTTTTTTTKKSVSFADSATMRLTRHINEYTPQEIQDAYYTPQDYKDFKTDIKRTVRMMEMKKAIDDNGTFCTRGAESYTQEGLKMKSHVRLAAFVAVFDAFDPRGPIDQWDDIAAAYTAMSMASARRAHMVGLADHEEIMAVAQTEEEQEQESSRKNASTSEVEPQQKKQRFQLSWGQKNNNKENSVIQSRKPTMFTRTRIVLRRSEIPTF